jgi:hypothetical protein
MFYKKFYLHFIVMHKSGLKIEITAVVIRHTDHVAPSIHKSWH